MKVELGYKYNVGDTVFYMYNGKITSAKIWGINVNFFINNVNDITTHDIEYKVTPAPLNKMSEKDVYKSKKELIESL